MITRRETINVIATMRYENKSLDTIARTLNIALRDVVAAVVAWKL
jgi:hypothetical protein